MHSLQSMESRRMRGAALVLIVALLWMSSASAVKISIYWGQNGNEASLKKTCESGNFEIVMLAFLIKAGNGQKAELNLAGHDWSSVNGHIKSCQSKGVKVFLSLGGGQNSNINIISKDDAQVVATYLWNNYLGGTSSNRPLGDAILDGIDFDIESATGHLDDLATALSVYSASSKKKVYLSAAPQCPDDKNLLVPALKTGLFDYVWIQFYNNHDCMYVNDDTSNLVKSWNLWTTSVTTAQSGSFYLGLPAAPDAAPHGGYIKPDKLISDVLPKIKDSAKYGGVMLWDKYWDEQTYYSSSIIKDSVKMKPSPVDVPTLASV